VGAMNRQRGYTLLEWVITIGLMAVLLAAGGGFAYATRPYATRSAVSRVSALLVTARSVAASTGNGATLTFTAAAENQTVVTLYAGRPNGGTFGTVLNTTTLPVAISTATIPATTFTLFIDSAGTGTASTWVLTSGTLATEPPCPGALDLTFASGGGSQTHALSCADMVLQ